MMRSALVVTVAAVCLSALSVPVQAANLVVNGSFEDATNFVNQGNDTMDLNVGSTLMPAWTVSGSHYVSWIGPTNPFGLTASPGAGDYFLDLTGYIFGAPFSGVTQTITTTPGTSYLLTFALGSSPRWGVNDSLTASAAGTSQVFTTTNNGAQNNLWEAESLVFKATGATTTISFLGNSGFNYIGLDNVSVVEIPSGVPEPGTWSLMLLGFLGLGGMLRLQRRGDRKIEALGG